MELKVVATLVKKYLKISYPGIKFTSKTANYVSSDEVEIFWTGGPTQDELITFFDQEKFNTPNFRGVKGYRRNITLTRKAN